MRFKPTIICTPIFQSHYCLKPTKLPTNLPTNRPTKSPTMKPTFMSKVRFAGPTNTIKNHICC